MSNYEDLLETLCCHFLKCGTLDLAMLKDIDEDDIMDYIESDEYSGVEPSLNGILASNFDYMIEALRNDVEYALDNAKTDEEVEELEQLDVDSDITFYCNFIDSSIVIEKNADIYKKYLAKDISAIEDHCGFEFEY